MGKLIKYGKWFYDRSTICPNCSKSQVYKRYSYQYDNQGKHKSGTWECHNCGWGYQADYDITTYKKKKKNFSYSRY